MHPPRPHPTAAPALPGTSPRPFAIGDAMIVVALAACWLATFSRGMTPARARLGVYAGHVPGIVRYLYREGPRPPAFRNASMASIEGYLRWTPVTILVEAGVPLLPLATLGFLLFRLRQPRPPWRDLLRQPGMAGSLAAVLAVFLEVDLRWLGVSVPTPMPVNIGLAVAATWLVLGASRFWRGEPGWVDRLGRALGVCWVVLGVLVAVEEIRAA